MGDNFVPTDKIQMKREFGKVIANVRLRSCETPTIMSRRLLLKNEDIIGKWELGMLSPKQETLRKILEIYDLTEHEREVISNMLHK